MHRMAVHVLLPKFENLRTCSSRNPDICIVFWSECFEVLPATITNSYLIQIRSQSRFGTTSAEPIQTKTGSTYLN